MIARKVVRNVFATTRCLATVVALSLVGGAAALAAPGDFVDRVFLEVRGGGLSISADCDGNIYYFADPSSTDFIQADSSGNLISSTPVGGPGFDELTYDSIRGIFYAQVHDSNPVELWVIDPAGVAFSIGDTATISQGSFRDGIAYDPGDPCDPSDDEIYISGDMESTIEIHRLVLDAVDPLRNPPTGVVLDRVLVPLDAAGVPMGIAGILLGNGNELLVARPSEADILRVDRTTGAFLGTFASSLIRPEGLACDLRNTLSAPAVLVRPFGSFLQVLEGGDLTCGCVTCDVGCTYTQGYWKNHNRYRRNPSQQAPWPIDEDTLLCGETWLDILRTPPRGGNAFYILAHQWIAARLNVANGADGSAVAAEIAEAEVLLSSCIFDTSDRARAIELAGILADYNEGASGPGHCDDTTSPAGSGSDDDPDPLRRNGRSQRRRR